MGEGASRPTTVLLACGGEFRTGPREVRLVAERAIGSNGFLVLVSGTVAVVNPQLAMTMAAFLNDCIGRGRPGESFAVDMELKRTAKSVIERIVHLRDSL